MKLGERNIGTVDRGARVLVGAALLASVVTNTVAGAIGYVAVFLGAILVATGLLGSCALYSLMGMNTCGFKKKK